LGNPRFFKELPIEIEELPVIDMILFSHDHYDHLDYGSVKKLAGKTKQFAVPLGVGAHLEAWGIEKARITELDWWEDFKVQDISLIFTPSRHFSGRGLNNRFSTLWGSWVIIGKEEKLFFSGDGGYGPHFQEIGNRFGPFDFAMLECGQYKENWKEIHMMPEETALAALDLKAKEFMPIHWGAFSLAMHSWTDPVERVLAKSQELGLKIRVPKIGSMIEIKEESQPELYPWWINPDLVDLSDFQERKASIF
jgi:L-ascorbate metabolism protein UlaG (beta-lactamase superfamily)